MSSTLRSRWLLEPDIAFLNHGSFGACPRDVLDVQAAFREQMERQPVRFFVRELPALVGAARTALSSFLKADPQGLLFVPNATSGVNTALASFPFCRGDRVLLTDHSYNACRNAVHFIAERHSLSVDVVALPWPVQSNDEIMRAIIDGVRPQTRLAMLDHITSPTGIVMPIRPLVRELRARGVETLVDGAHAPGQVPLHLGELGAAYYTGNCHKWLFAPKGAAFLHAREDLRQSLRPLVISHGANTPVGSSSKLHIEFDWTGTADFTPVLALPAALRFGETLFEGGFKDLMARNRKLALAGKKLLEERLAVASAVPEDCIGAMAAIVLPDGEGEREDGSRALDPLQDTLWERFGIEVPIVPFPRWPQRLVRISAQAYNDVSEYHRLGYALEVLMSHANAP